MSEVIEHPLSADALSRRWRDILSDPRLANFVGKIDLDLWGGIAWILFPRGRRVEFYGKSGTVDRSSFEVDLSGVFD